MTIANLRNGDAAALVANPKLGDPILDNPAWASLMGPHRRFLQRYGGAARYLPDVAPFVALADHRDPQHWRDAAELVGPGGTFAIAGADVQPPPGWTSAGAIDGVQLIDVELVKRSDPEAVQLGAADVPHMLDLVARTQPGPFLPRTIELGNYLGIRRGGRLIAMAGERLHPPGWTEISAVCTDPAYRGQGLASRLVSAVGAGIAERGDRVLLHAAASNTTAIGLYLSIGFQLRRVTRFNSVTVPLGIELSD